MVEKREKETLSDSMGCVFHSLCFTCGESHHARRHSKGSRAVILRGPGLKCACCSARVTDVPKQGWQGPSHLPAGTHSNSGRMAGSMVGLAAQSFIWRFARLGVEAWWQTGPKDSWYWENWSLSVPSKRTSSLPSPSGSQTVTHIHFPQKCLVGMGALLIFLLFGWTSKKQGTLHFKVKAMQDRGKSKTETIIGLDKIIPQR